MSPTGERSVFDEDDDAAGALRRRIASGVGKARNALYLVAGMLFLTDVITLAFQIARFNLGAIIVLGTVGLVEIGGFVFLGTWAARRPFNAQLTGLVAMFVLEAIANLFHFYAAQHSLLIDLLIFGLLFSGLRRSRVVQRSMDYQNGRY